MAHAIRHDLADEKLEILQELTVDGGAEILYDVARGGSGAGVRPQANVAPW